MAKALTDRKLQALKRKPPKAGTTRDVDDGEVPGLKVRVMPSGWILAEISPKITIKDASSGTLSCNLAVALEGSALCMVEGSGR